MNGSAFCNHMKKNRKLKITIFHCINTLNGGTGMPHTDENEFELRMVKLACSSMVKDVFLLRAFEAGSDAVIVLVCPEGQCRYLEGNIRAKKRVTFVKKLLDEIGLDGRRLSIFNISSKDEGKALQILQKIRSDLADLGLNQSK